MVGHPEQARARLVELNKNSGWMSRADRLSIWDPLIQFQAFVDNEAAIQYGKEALAAYGWEIREKTPCCPLPRKYFGQSFYCIESAISATDCPTLSMENMQSYAYC